MNDVRISQAERADLPELLTLLAAVDLPHEGVEEHIDGFMVAWNLPRCSSAVLMRLSLGGAS